MFSPLAPYMTGIKIAVVVILIAVFAGMTWQIKYLSAKVGELEAQLTLSEDNNKILNDSIESQNISITESNKKYNDVQKKLYEANGKNQAINTQFKTIREKIVVQQVPATCEAARVEMITTSKEIVQKWKK
jgi:hypothetical protein